MSSFREVAGLGDRGREVTEMSGPGRLENSPPVARQPRLLHSHKAPWVIGFLKPWAKLRPVGSQMGGNEISRHQTPERE